MSGFPVIPEPVSPDGCDCRLLPYWAALKQWREQDQNWPKSVYWHLFESQLALSEKVLDKCYRNFVKA